MIDEHRHHIHINPNKKENPMSNQPNDLDALASRYEQAARELRQRAEEERQRAARVEPDDLPVGAVLVWTRQYRPRGNTYTYAAVKGSDGKYYTSDGSVMDWAELAAENPGALVTIYRQPCRSEIPSDSWAFRSVHCRTVRW